MQVRRVGNSIDELGESCVWSEREQALYWVDVRGRCLRRWDQNQDVTESFPLPELVGATALHARGGVLVAMQSAVARFDIAQKKLESVAWPTDLFANLRFNDARCDRQGRFWAGTMDDVGRGPVGTLYRLNRDGSFTAILSSITIPNSLAWSPDSSVMYFSDTTSSTIMAFDFDADAGLPSNPRVFAHVEGPGTPDGSTVDADGFLWNAEYDGWKITRYSPDGRIDRVIPLPLRRPTCCTFGGPDLSTLFVTTASQKLTPQERADQPLAGALLALDVGIRGIAEPSYGR